MEEGHKTNSCSKDIGRGSSSKDFRAEVKLIRCRSVSETEVTVERSKVVGEKMGVGGVLPNIKHILAVNEDK